MADRVERVYMATVVRTREQAVKALTERGAAFYGVAPEEVTLTLTSVDQETDESFSICGAEPIVGEARFSVEGYVSLAEGER